MASPTEHDFQPRWIAVKNDGVEEAPAFGVARITGIDDDGVIKVARPNARSMTNVVFIGETAIPVGEIGPATMTPPAKALTDSADGTIALATGAAGTWGTENGTWKLRKANTGFTAIAEIATGLGLFRPTPGSGGGGGGVLPEEPDEPGGSVAVTFDIYRPFGGASTYTSISGMLYDDYVRSRRTTDPCGWTHLLVVDDSVDILDGTLRVAGSNVLTYADGDEVRIGSAVYVVVWVETQEMDEATEYKNVFLMRHSP